MLDAVVLPRVEEIARGVPDWIVPFITPIDLNWIGRPHTVAAALLESQGQLALLDPGPASTVETLRAELASRGLSVGDIQTIFLTHIHLDPAGATGALVRENPRLRVYVHAKGAPHLIDPSKLLSSAGRLWGDDLPRLFGETLPVPAENLDIVYGGESLALGHQKLEVLYTPGHASHHVSFIAPQEGVAFVGDTAGIRMLNGPFIMPATPPPDIDLALWDESFQAIKDRRPARLFVTHFGFAENPEEHLAAFRDRLHHWASITERALQTAPDEASALKIFLAETHADMTRYLTSEAAEQHAFTAGLNLSFLGLTRHIRKRSIPTTQPR
jgi:glyoxylase-like metal-dependent hydrolase (beta-lactamase superfamily II)